MKIPQQLPQFNDKHVLLVVMGSHHGIIYKASEGKLEKVDELRIDTPVYSDNEGMFKRGGGKDISYGSVLEPKKEKAQKDFSVSLAEKVFEYRKHNNLDHIYLYAPKEMKSLIEIDWHNEIKELIEERLDGNYVSKTPVELLKMLN